MHCKIIKSYTAYLVELKHLNTFKSTYMARKWTNFKCGRA